MGGYGANQFGTWFEAGDIDWTTHKLLHGMLGAIMGGASDLKHPLDGMIGGSMGASLAEMLIETLPDTLSPQTRSDITRMSVALITLFTGQDVNASILTATNAIENNSLSHYSSDPEVMLQQMEEERQAWEDITRDIPELVHMRESLHECLESLHKLSSELPLLKNSQIYQSLNALNTWKNHALVDVLTPTSSLDLGLIVTGGSLKGFEKGVRFFTQTERLAIRTQLSRTLETMKLSKSSQLSHPEFYHSHRIRELLEIKYPSQISSTTVPSSTAKNVRLAGKRHPVSGIVFDHKGFPIFDDVTVFDTKLIKEFSGLKNEHLHMREATKNLRTEIVEGRVNKSQFTKFQLEDIMAGKDRISGYTWHHHQDIGRMQLIPRETHIETGHIGGMEMWFSE